MLCRRCKGRLVPETFGDVSEELARMCAATRCINCGCIDDSVVHANRLRHPMAKRPASRGRPGPVDGQKGRSRVRNAL